MGVCMSQDEKLQEIVQQNIASNAILPEKTGAEMKKEPKKPFTYENFEISHAPEKYAVVCMPHVSGLECDRLGIFDLDETSSKYLQIISTLRLGRNDEPGRINWTSTVKEAELKTIDRTHIIVPCMNTSRIYVVSMEGNIMRVVKLIKGQELIHKDISCPYAVRTLPIKGAPVHISTLGDRDGHGKGDFVLLDRHTFQLRERTKCDKIFPGCGGDFAFQTRHNIMITTEWGAPKLFRQGFTVSDLENVSETFGNCLHVWKISPPELLQTIELDEDDGSFTMAIKFVHNTEINHAFVCSAIGSSLYHLFMDTLSGEWVAELVTKILPIPVKNWESSEMPALLTDMVISFDDRWLFVAGYLHGKIWRFDVSDPFNVSMHSMIALGGLLCGDIIPTGPTEEDSSPSISIKGSSFRGGPAILQLSLDGKRLYVSNSIYKAWDAQFYPELISEGGQIIRIDVSPHAISLANHFLIDLKTIDGGPFLPRDLRFYDV